MNTYTTSTGTHVIDPLDVKMAAISHMMEMWVKDSDPNRIYSVLKMEKQLLEMEYNFKTNMN